MTKSISMAAVLLAIFIGGVSFTNDVNVPKTNAVEEGCGVTDYQIYLYINEVGYNFYGIVGASNCDRLVDVGNGLFVWVYCSPVAIVGHEEEHG